MKEYHIVCPDCSISRKVNKNHNSLNNRKIKETGKGYACRSCSAKSQYNNLSTLEKNKD